MLSLAKPKETKKLLKDIHRVGLVLKILTTIDARIHIEKGCAIHAWTLQKVDVVPCDNLGRICSTQRTNSMEIILILQSIQIILCRVDIKIARSKTQKLQTSLKVMTTQM